MTQNLIKLCFEHWNLLMRLNVPGKLGYGHFYQHSAVSLTSDFLFIDKQTYLLSVTLIHSCSHGK